MFAGISVFFVGLCSLIVPLYKILCERWGFSIKTSHVDYQVDAKDLNVHKKWTVHFKARMDPDMDWRFEPQVPHVVVNAGETALVFYKAYNNSDKPIVGLSIYQVDPNDSVLYFNKIQCFCFEN